MTKSPRPGDSTTDAAPGWAADQLRLVSVTKEPEITTRGQDGAQQPWVPIWMVHVGTEIYVRTWHRRDTGWFGHAVAAQRARIRMPGLETDVEIHDVGNTDTALRYSIDDAYRVKYHDHGASSVQSMTTDDATAATLRLVPPQP
jgi:hypothetical protein